jgi:hypothetical protein
LFSPDERKFGRWGYIILNAPLYDGVAGFWRSVFTHATWMRQRYGFQYSLLLPFHYLRRARDLMFRRVS